MKRNAVDSALWMTESTAKQIVRLAANLIAGETPCHHGYRSDSGDADMLVDEGYLVEDQEQPGIFYATLDGLAFAGFDFPIPPSVRDGGCTCQCDDNGDACAFCRGACSSCRGAGRRWQTVTMQGRVVPTFNLEPCLDCEGTGWKRFEDSPCLTRKRPPEAAPSPKPLGKLLAVLGFSTVSAAKSSSSRFSAS